MSEPVKAILPEYFPIKAKDGRTVFFLRVSQLGDQVFISTQSAKPYHLDPAPQEVK
jgi:hypothetical protein